MQCAKCGAEVKPTDACCPHCSVASHKVDIIDEQQPDQATQVIVEEPGYYEHKNTGPHHRIYVKQVNVARMGFWPMLVGGLLLLLVFVLALPIALLLTFISAVFWFFIRRR